MLLVKNGIFLFLSLFVQMKNSVIRFSKDSFLDYANTCVSGHELPFILERGRKEKHTNHKIRTRERRKNSIH